MRFNQYSRRMQVWLTVFWVAILALWTDVCFGAEHPRYGALVLWSITGVLNLCSVWLNYWIVDEDGFSQHGLFYRRWFSARGLRYAGPVRSSRLSWLLRRSIEVEMGRAQGPPAPRFVTVADRPGFLQALRRIAPHAEIIAGSST